MIKKTVFKKVFTKTFQAGKKRILSTPEQVFSKPEWAGVTVDDFDCSGFIYHIYKEVGLDIKRLDTIAFHNNSFDIEDPVPGDLLLFENTYRNGISHAGIYLGDGKFIHAGSKNVEVSSIESGYWKPKFTGFKRLNSLHE